MSALNSVRSLTPAWRSGPGTHLHIGQPGRPNLVAVPCEPRPPETGVSLERRWREPPEQADRTDPHRIVARRWRAEGEGIREHAGEADPRFAVLAIALRRTDARMIVEGECVHDGPVPAGFASLSRAGLSSRVQFRAQCDFLHLFVPSQRLARIERDILDQATAQGRVLPWLSAADPLIERLAWLLLKGGGDDEMRSSNPYLDGLGLAIVSRLLERSRGEERASRGLVKWRLKRVQQFVDDQLSEPLSLADLARCAGLSRMHFAAQFRAATGMRPHEYLVRRRIQRAQEILLTTGMPLVEVALSVGFQTQAHFTTVFRRFLGETPGRWRQAQRVG